MKKTPIKTNIKNNRTKQKQNKTAKKAIRYHNNIQSD